MSEIDEWYFIDLVVHMRKGRVTLIVVINTQSCEFLPFFVSLLLFSDPISNTKKLFYYIN